MKKIFIDGRNGTTGLRIDERLLCRDDVEILVLPEEKRKDPVAKKEMLNKADVVFLCLPDDAARESVAMIENPSVCVIDTSTAHRTDPNWAYGFPELSEDFLEKIKKNNKIELLDCQVDLILRSLEFYRYTYNFIYPRSNKSKTLEENLRISLVNDTYEQILNQFGISKSENPILGNFENVS